MGNSHSGDIFERLSNVADGIYFFENDRLTNVSRWSDSAVRYFALPPEYATNTMKVWLERIHPADKARYINEIEKVFNGEKPRHDCRYRAQNFMGEYVWLECMGSVTRDEKGVPISFEGIMLRLGAGLPVVDRQEVTNCLSLPEKYKDISCLEGDIAALQAAQPGSIGVLVVGETHESGRYDANEQLAAILNLMDEVYPEKDIYREGETTLVLLARGLDYASYSEKRRYIRDYILDNERDNISYGYAWCEDMTTLRDQVVIAYTYQQVMEQRMNGAAQRRYYALDKLTRIPHMDFFTDFATAILKTSGLRHDFVFLYFNIDNFKTFNSEYGFQAGDEVLVGFAHLLNTVFPNYINGRVTSDRFVVFTDNRDLLPRIQQLHEAAHKLQRNVRLEVKVGICHYTPGMGASAACDNAKIACDTIMGDYSRTYCFYDAALGDKLLRQKYLVDNLDAAIQNEYLKVYYQPVIRVLTGALCGVESLVRWNDPKQGFLSPGEFIPMLEKQNLIHKLDAFVLDRVCRDLQFADSMGERAVPVSVNISRKDFQLCNVFDLVTGTVKKYGIDPRLIHIEVTESALNDNPDELATTIAKFQAAGFEVWLDDFGSEYSTLNVLQEYRFDVLKIDMRFFATMESNESARTIITSIVDMGKQLHTRILAEGIETKAQYDFLRKIGCDKAQGFYMCRPQPLAALRGLFDRVETADQARYYDDIARVNCLSPDPIRGLEGGGQGSSGVAAAIVRYHAGSFSYLYTNDDFVNCLQEVGVPSLAASMRYLNDDSKKLKTRLRGIARKCHETQNTESIDLLAYGNQINIRVREVASTANSRAFLVRMNNLSGLADIKKIDRLNAALNFLYSIYDRVDLLDFEADKIENIYLNVEYYMTNLNGQPVMQGVRAYAYGDVAVEDREKFLAFYDRATLKERLAASDKSYLVEAIRTRRVNNEVGLQLYIIIPVSDGKGERYLSCVRDLDEGISTFYDGKLARDTGRAAEWYNMVSRVMDVGVMEWDLVEKECYVSGACYQYLLGHESMDDVLQNKGRLDVFYPEDLPQVRRFFAATKSGAPRAEVVVRLRLTEGGYRWCRLTGIFQRDAAGELARVFGIIARLPDNWEARFSQLRFLDKVPDGIGIFEIDGHAVRQTYMSAGFYEMMRDDRSTRLARQETEFLNNVHPDDRAAVRETMRRVMEEGEDFVTVCCRARTGEGDYRAIRMAARVAQRNGEHILVYTTYVPLDTQGKLPGKTGSERV